jgi:MoxR-like ATPase
MSTATKTAPSTALENIKNIGVVLSKALVCRDEEVSILQLSLVAKEHCLFIGDPGTAKSMLARSLGVAVDAREFGVLLTKFSTPDDVFGPVSLSGLKNDEYRRVTGNRLADCEIGFIDEVFKANAAILNSMLTVMQERIYDNGGARVKTPLRTLIGASNEWPEQGELDALFDRFMMRRSVQPVPPSERHRLLFSDLPPVNQVASIADIDTAHTEAMQLPFTQETQDCYMEMISTLQADKIAPGDRRCRNALKIARAAAWLDGSPAVERHHLESLKDVLWPRHEMINATHEIVLRLTNPSAGELMKMIGEATEIFNSGSIQSNDAGKQLADVKKLDEIIRRASTLTTSKKVRQFIHSVKVHICKLKAKHMNIDVEQMLKVMKLDAEFVDAADAK